MQPQSFSIVQGETLDMPVAVTDSDGEPYDLSGMTPLFGVARFAGGTLVVDTAGAPPTATATIRGPATDGVVDVSVPGTAIAPLIGTYEWECRARDSANAEVVIARGYLTVAPRILGVPASP